jgi:hypothetical protein
MLLYSPRWLFLYPGLFLMLVGLGVGAWLLPGPQRLAGVVLDVHTLLYAALAVLIGFQCITFALLAKVFAINEGLLPEDPRLTKMFQYITLETGLIIGSLLVVGGIAGSITAVISWNEVAYGPLDASRTLRTVIPSVLCLMLGCETILASLFLSILGLHIRRMAPATEVTTAPAHETA